MSAKPLSRAQIDTVIATARAAHLEDPDRRSLLLAGLPPEIVNRLPRKERPAEQLMSDVHQLAGFPPEHLDRWLAQAAQLAEPFPAHSDALRSLSTAPHTVVPTPARSIASRGTGRRPLLVAAVVIGVVVVGALAANALMSDSQDATVEQVKAFVREGRALHTAKDYTGAVKAFSAASELAPLNPRVLGELGWANYRSGDAARAEALFKSALVDLRDPKLAGSIHHNLGMLYTAQDRIDLAIEHYTLSLKVRPGNSITTKALRRARKKATER